MASFKRISLALIVAGAMCLCVGGVTLAQDDDAKKNYEGEWTPGPPSQLAEIGYLLGKWDVTVDITGPEGEKQQLTGSSHVTELLGGAALQENLTLTMGEHTVDMLVMFSFDRRSEVFRVARLDNMQGAMEVMQGEIDANGDLVLTNKENGTAKPNHEGDGHEYARLTLHKLSESIFEIAWAISPDDGKTWKDVGTMTYTRAA